jgi:hypothetical protein
MGFVFGKGDNFSPYLHRLSFKFLNPYALSCLYHSPNMRSNCCLGVSVLTLKNQTFGGWLF